MSDIRHLTIRIKNDGVLLHFRGRDAWALYCLIQAGEAGCTPICHPGPRWSGYVFKLRRKGLQVETITEKHAAPYAGTHARYVLRTTVEIVDAVAREVAA